MKRGRVMTRGAASASTRRMLRRKNIVDDSEEEEEDSEEEEEASQEEEEEDDEEEEEEEEEDEEQGEDEEEEGGRRRSKRLKKSHSNEKDEQDDEENEDEEEEEEEEERDESSPERPPRTRSAARRSQQNDKAKEKDEEDDEEEEDEDEEEERRVTKKPTRKKSRAIDDEEGEQEEQKEEEDDDAEPPQPPEEEVEEETKPQETPTSSPMKPSTTHKRLSIDILMNQAPEPDEHEEKQEEDEEKEAEIRTKLPYHDIRDVLAHTKSEGDVMEILAKTFNGLLKENKQPPRLLCIGLICAVKQQPEIFDQPNVLKYLLRLLRSKHYTNHRHEQSGSDGKKSTGSNNQSHHHPNRMTDLTEVSIPVLVTNLLLHIMKNKRQWPIDSIKVYLDDSLYARVWVDHELSQPFVENVKSILQAADAPVEPDPSVPCQLVDRRFFGVQLFHEMRDLFVNHMRSRLTELEKEKTSGPGSNNAMRNMILTLSDFAMFPPVRLMAAENMEVWLQNPSFKGPARELLGKIISCCQPKDTSDTEMVDILLKMKLKSTMFQLKVETITQLVKQNQAYLRQALSVYIARERPNNMGKDVDNMKMLQHIFRAAKASSSSGTLTTSSTDETFYSTPLLHPGAVASRELARVFRDLASSPEVSSVLKTIVRKILKQLTFDHVDIKSLCVGMLENDGHWDMLTKYADTRMLEYMGLVTSTIWLVLLMRGAAVKSLQIQQSNMASGRSSGSSGAAASGNTMMKLGTQAIPRRGVNPPSGMARTPKVGARDGKMTPSSAGSKPKPSTSAGSTPPHASSSSASTPSDPSRAIKVAVKAREELLQAFAYVQNQAIRCCLEIFSHFSLNGTSSFERLLYEAIVKKLLFLEIPVDMQPTEHDKTCFLSTKEEIPMHERTLLDLTQLYHRCPSIDRLEALRTIETIVIRAADGHLARETLWGSQRDQLKSYSKNGGVVGLEVLSAEFVYPLLQLTMWHSEQKSDVDFCYTSRFWISCSILLILAAFNPTTVGDFLWQEVPTLRCLMQMVITGRFAFPPIQTTSALHDPLLLGKHRVNFSNVMDGNNQLRDYETQVMQSIPAASVENDSLMVLEVNGTAREPPAPILEHLKALDRKYKLGVRLRQSRSKDFLMEMVADSDRALASGDNEKNGGSSAWWIADIVCEEADTVQYLPYGCLCKLLLLAQRKNDQQMTATDKLQEIVPRLLAKLREYLHDPNETTTASNVLIYFLDCLVAHDVETRRIGSSVLELLSSSDGYDGTKAMTSMRFDWLARLVPLPCYNLVRDRVFGSLETLLDSESSIPSLQLCLQALHTFWQRCNPSEPSTDAEALFIEQTMLLARAFGKLLSTREFVADFLLQKQEIYRVFVEILWAAIDHQLVFASSKSHLRISLPDCKVFYALDRSNAIREIRLPVTVIHGLLHLICSPHAVMDEETNDDASKRQLIKILDCLFPRPTGASSIAASAGLIATKDVRLYPSSLLQKLAMSSRIAYLVEMVIKAMPLATLWSLVQSYGLSDDAMATAATTLYQQIQTAEDKVWSAFTEQPEAENRLHQVILQLQAYQESVGHDSKLVQSVGALRSWLESKASLSQAMDTNMDHESLLSTSFIDALCAQQETVPANMEFPVEVEQEVVVVGKRKEKSKDQADTQTLSDHVVFKKRFVLTDSDENDASVANRAGTIERQRPMTINYGTKHLCRVIQSLWSSCSKEKDHDDTSERWKLHAAVLQSLHTTCHSSSAAAELAQALLQLLEHVMACCNPSHRDSCVQLAQRICHHVGRSCSYAACVSFLKEMTQLPSSMVMLQASLSTEIASQLCHLVLSCAKDCIKRWFHRGVVLQLDNMTLHNTVVLVQTYHVLKKLQHPEETVERPAKRPRKPAQAVADVGLQLLQRLMSTEYQQTQDTTTVVMGIVVAIVDGAIPLVSGSVMIRRQTRCWLLQTLYNQNPTVVGPVLDAIQPDWKTLVKVSDATSLQVPPAISSIIQHVLTNTDASQSSEALDRFREAAIRHPVVMAAAFPMHLSSALSGNVSLTQLYTHPAVYSQIVSAIDMLLPTLSSSDGLGVCCNALVEILNVVARHQAIEFYALVARIFDVLYDALAQDFEGFGAVVFHHKATLDAIMALFGSQSDITTMQSLQQVHQQTTGIVSTSVLKPLMTTIRDIQTRRGVTAEQLTVLEDFVHKNQLQKIQKSHHIAKDALEQLTTTLQTITQVLATTESDIQSTVLPILRLCARVLVQYLVSNEVLTKALLHQLCQVLLQLMRRDPTVCETILHRYVDCLQVLRPGLKETAMAFALEFLTLATSEQSERLLECLYHDSSDLARAKILAYLKSPAFKLMKTC